MLEDGGLSKQSNLANFQGDMDYVKYVDEVSKDKSQYTFPDISTGIKKLSDDNTIMHGLDVMLRGTFQENPYDLPDIKLFGKTRPKFYCLMLTKNSPLTPIFMKAITRTTEQGVLDRMAVSWTGPPITYSGVVETMILAPGQVFLVFGMLGTLLLLCLFILSLEMVFYNTQALKMAKILSAPKIREEFCS